MTHNHVLYDSDPHFKIDPISRKIINESSTKTTVIQHDHNSERFTFECPRYVEGHDLSECNSVEIHYLNIESNTKIVRTGVYTVTDLQVKADDENTVVCSWLLGNNATQLVGQLQFLVRYACVNEETGAFEYIWNTAVYSSISVSAGIYNGDSSSDNPVPAYNFVTAIDGTVLKFFVGTKAKYNALTHEQKIGVFAIITDDTTREDLEARIDKLEGNCGISGAPQLSSSKTLPEKGYYYVYAHDTGLVMEVFNFGLIYWDGVHWTGATGNSNATLSIAETGEIGVIVNLDGTNSDITNRCNVYIKKLWSA